MNLLEKFLSRTEFDSYEDFVANFKLKIPENFNFAYDVVDYYAEHEPDKRAIVWCNDNGQEEIFSFARLQKYVNKTANVFKKYGISKGDHVLLTLKSRYEFWFCLVALHKLGAIAVPATHMLTKKDLVYRIDRANVKMAVSADEAELLDYYDQAFESVSDVINARAVLHVDRPGWVNFSDEIEQASDVFERPQGDQVTHNEDVSLLYFSSGTSGQPKMVQHNYLYSLAHIITAKYWQNVEDDGLHYTVADTGWGKCVWGKIYGQWIAGSAVFIYDYERFHADKMAEMAAKYGVTTFCAPPTIYRFLIKEDLSQYDFSTLKYAVTAGEALNPEVYEKFYQNTGLKLMEGYGQTETTLIAATFVWMEPKVGSLGKPSPLYNLSLLDSEGNESEIGEHGELSIDVAAGTPVGLFSGYRGDPERTNDVLYGEYYRTGDLAWKDEDGYLWFVGRADDVIKSSGYRIGPFEVESALIEHPAVLECAITGAPDPVRGQIVKATIVLTKGYSPSDELIKEMQNHVKNTTAPYKYPRIIEFVDELPKTISGKIRRVEIRNKDRQQD